MSQHILAIDDEPHMLVLLERIVQEKTPYTIKITSNALEVPDILERESFDIIVTDLKMPKLDGLAILKQVQEEKRPELVVLITAFGTLDTAREARALGAFDYITKPFRKEEILICIERGMAWQRARRAQGNLEELLAKEPLAAAEELFRTVYLKAKAGELEGDLDALERRTGAPRDMIEHALKM